MNKQVSLKEGKYKKQPFRTHPHTRFYSQAIIWFECLYSLSPRIHPSSSIISSSSYSRVVETGRSRAISATRQQTQGRSRPTERQFVGKSNLQPIRRAASSQHFAEPTIAYARKIKGKRITPQTHPHLPSLRGPCFRGSGGGGNDDARSRSMFRFC